MADTFPATFLVVFRETLEAGLLVGIILAALAHLHSSRYVPQVLASASAAVAASFLLAWGFHQATQEVQGVMEKGLEGGISLFACAVLTHMVFWMDRQAQRIRPEIEEKMGKAVTKGEHFTILSLPFVAVLREGAETVLFLEAVAIQHSRAVSWLGGLLGAGGALLVSVLIFVGGRKIPLRAFFRSTGVLLLLMAAGLLAYGIHEFQELGWLPLRQIAWDINPILNEKKGIGGFLKSLFGYNGNPSLLEVVAYGAYLFGVWLFLKGRARSAPTPASS